MKKFPINHKPIGTPRLKNKSEKCIYYMYNMNELKAG